MAVSKRLRTEIFRRDDHTCQYCGRKAPDVPITVDHVTPVALGGTDDPTNLITACKDCNAGKSSIAPDSPLVAQVKDDAMRWQMAWAAAVAEAEQDGTQRAENISTVITKYINAYEGRHGDRPMLPEGWQASIGRWLDLGLPMALIDKAIASSIGRNYIRADKRWNYFAGCCWSLLRELGNRAKQIAEVAEAAAESWDQKLTRHVVDTTVMAWREMWMSSQGADPEPGQEELVRETALRLYPEEIDPGLLIRGAWDAAESGSSDIDKYVCYDFDPTPEDPDDQFDSMLSQSYFTGLANYQSLADFSLNPDEWMAIAIQASAAMSAGYTIDAVSIAVYEAGQRGDARVIKWLDTPWVQLAKEHPKTLILERAAVTHLEQAVLDKLIASARAQAARASAERERHAAECDGNPNCWMCSSEVPF